MRGPADEGKGGVPAPETRDSLLVRLKQQQPEAWQQLDRLYGDKVQEWCRDWGRRLGLPADDLRQDIILHVKEQIDKFRTDRPGKSFRGWLYRVVQRKALDHGRRRAVEPHAVGGSDAKRRLDAVPEADPDGDVPAASPGE